ncbi:MAG: hypothetical protein ACE5EY_10600 [Anaerolineae bacterium]
MLPRYKSEPISIPALRFLASLVSITVMRWDLHGIIIEGRTNDNGLADWWRRSFASRPVSTAVPHLHITLNLTDSVPAPPPGDPDFTQGDLLAYYLDGETAVAHFPRFGQLALNLGAGTTDGRIVPAALHTYGVLEDLIAISLSPHLRRRGRFLIHAFAAAVNGRALLLVGSIGAGKTTTGMALLNAGWRLLSNDSPIIGAGGRVFSYPGLLAAYPETFGRFPATRHLAKRRAARDGRAKLTFPAEEIWPDVWLDRAAIGAICFPVIEARADHALEPIPAPQALARLLPHAVEQWDKAMMPPHLAALRQLVESAPAYRLRLGQDVAAIPTFFQKEINL